MGRRGTVVRPGSIVLLLVMAALALLAAAPAALAQLSPGDELWNRRSALPGNEAAVGLGVLPNGDFAGVFNVGMDADFLESVSIGVASFAPDGSTWNPGSFGDADTAMDTANGLAVAPDGTIAVAGTRRPLAAQDYLLVRFTSLGALLGSQTWNGPANVGDVAKAVAVDASGACYLTGQSWSRKSASFDVVTVKYSAAGARLWTAWFDGAKASDLPVGIVVRGTSVYVAARSRRSGHGDDVALLKYAAGSGNLSWSRFYDDALHRNDWPADVVATSSGVYVAGLGKQATGKPADALLLRYTSTGAFKWARYTGGTGRDAWVDLEGAPDGRVRMTGSTVRTATASDVMTASWRSDGTLAWRTTFSTVGVFDEKGVALAVDAATGATYVLLSQETSDVDARVVAYEADGTTRWIGDPYMYFANEDDMPADIAVSGSTVAFACTSGTPVSGVDYVIEAYEK